MYLDTEAPSKSSKLSAKREFPREASRLKTARTRGQWYCNVLKVLARSPTYQVDPWLPGGCHGPGTIIVTIVGSSMGHESGTYQAE